MATTLTCTRRIEFDAGHRVVEHESKCKFLHGHRYVIQASFSAPALDSVGRVIDFGQIKGVLGGWIDENWDHTLILWKKDQELGESIAKQTGQTVYYMPYNPTAENMARYLLETICPELFADSDIACTGIVIHETPNCSASATV